MRTFFENIKQSLLLLALGALASLIPFYFQTSAQTQATQQVNTEQTRAIQNTGERLHVLEIKGAVDDTEIRQIKESLQRIEKKIDKLIEQRR